MQIFDKEFIVYTLMPVLVLLLIDFVLAQRHSLSASEQKEIVNLVLTQSLIK